MTGREREMLQNWQQMFFTDGSFSVAAVEQKLGKLVCASTHNFADFNEHLVFLFCAVHGIIDDGVTQPLCEECRLGILLPTEEMLAQLQLVSERT